MARETLNANGRFAATLTTSDDERDVFRMARSGGPPPARRAVFRPIIPTPGCGSTGWVTPSTAMRGMTGDLDVAGSDTITMPEQIYLGYAVSSNNTNDRHHGAILPSLTGVTNAVVAAVAPPHEPLGPSSRRPRSSFLKSCGNPYRARTKNLEFLEIYNSNPWFHDISGYQLTCADMTYTFPAGTTWPAALSGGGGRRRRTSQSVYGITNVMGPYTGSLKKAETLQLLDERTNVLLTVPVYGRLPLAGGHGWHRPFARAGRRPMAKATRAPGASATWWAVRPGRWTASPPARCATWSSTKSCRTEIPAVPQFIELYNHSTNSVEFPAAS